MDTSNKFLGSERIGKLMGKYALPCIISLLVGALYNIVDQIFIANASYLGSYGNAANTVVFPLTVVALAIAVMIGDGCCAFVSIALGRGEDEKAKLSVGNSIVLTIFSSIVLTAVYLIFADGIISVFGGTVNEETFRHSQEYFFYISIGIPFYMFGQAMNPRHKSGRKSGIRDGVHPCRSCNKHNLRPRIYIRIQMGHDGRGGCDCYRSGSNRNSCNMVYFPYESN